MSKWEARRQPEPPHPFPHSLASDEWVILSGVAGFDPATGKIPEDAAAQAEAVINNSAWALEAAGSSWAEVVFIKIHVSDRAHIETTDPVIRRMIPEPRPASGGIIVTGLVSPDIKIEFDVWARRGAQRVQVD